jgi:hypothetical protein
MTLLFVKDVSPRGKVGGAVKPVSANSGLVMSMPLSSMATLIPLPAVAAPPSCCHIAGAWMSGTLRFSVARYVLVSRRRRTAGSSARAATSSGEASTEIALSRVWHSVLIRKVGATAAAATLKAVCSATSCAR